PSLARWWGGYGRRAAPRRRGGPCLMITSIFPAESRQSDRTSCREKHSGCAALYASGRRDQRCALAPEVVHACSVAQPAPVSRECALWRVQRCSCVASSSPAGSMAPGVALVSGTPDDALPTLAAIGR